MRSYVRKSTRQDDGSYFVEYYDDPVEYGLSQFFHKLMDIVLIGSFILGGGASVLVFFQKNGSIIWQKVSNHVISGGILILCLLGGIVAIVLGVFLIKLLIQLREWIFLNTMASDAVSVVIPVGIFVLYVALCVFLILRYHAVQRVIECWQYIRQGLGA